MNIKRWLLGGLITVGGLAVVLALVFYFYAVLPMWGYPFNAQRHTHVPITPPWALECWLWEDDVNTEAYVYELIDGYAKYDIPVRAIIIDSPWSLRYNDFKFDEARYPKPKEFFKDLHSRGYRIVCWMTPNVNYESDKDVPIHDSRDWFDEARKKGYLINNGDNWKHGRWWKGKGGYIDYTNPAAVQWWQGMQQEVFDFGLDGWKQDGSDTLCMNHIGPVPLFYLRSHKGWMTTRGYMDLYARVEYQHGLTQNPEFITMIRSYDTPWAHPEGFAPLDAAPVTWIGDRHHAWRTGEELGKSVNAKDLMMKDADEGIEAAIRDILLSAKNGYCVVGDDIGGYHGGKIIPPHLYIRWAEFAAFTGFFLNGGHGERRMWKRTDEELQDIRKFSWMHTELVPYMYTYVVNCHNGATPLQRPMKEGAYQYMFGDDFLVAPVYVDSLERAVVLPAGHWRYLFHDQEVVDGPKAIKRDFPMDEFPVYVRDGAVFPLKVSRDYTGFGDKESEGFLTWVIYPSGDSAFTLHNCDKPGQITPSGDTTIKVTQQGERTEVTLSGDKKPHILRVLLPQKPKMVSLDGKALAENTAWRYDQNRKRLIVKTSDYAEGHYMIE